MKKKHGSILCLCLGGALLFVAGCFHFENQSAMQDGDGFPTAGIINSRMSELQQKLGYHETTIEGKLFGDSIVYNPGAKGDRGKGNNPMTIRFDEYELALTTYSENVALQLIRYSEKDVRLLGSMASVVVIGREGNSSGQQGYTGPIPDHKVYFFKVRSVTLVDKAID